MKTYIFRLALVAAGVATSLPAAAADHPLADRIFERMDTNNDDKVDAGEMEQARAARFKRLDANGDGVVSAADLLGDEHPQDLGGVPALGPRSRQALDKLGSIGLAPSPERSHAAS